MWRKHRVAVAELPQKCQYCGTVLIEDKTNEQTGARVSDPLPANTDVFQQDSGEEKGAIATMLPPSERAENCKSQ